MVRQVFDNYNLISGLHSYMSTQNSKFKNLLPPLRLLNSKESKELFKKLETLKFSFKKISPHNMILSKSFKQNL